MLASLMAKWVEQNQCPSRQSILLTQGPIREILATIAQLLGVVEKLSFFESAILIFFFKKNSFFFCFIPMKIRPKLCIRIDGTQFLWLCWFTAKNHSPQTYQPAVYCDNISKASNTFLYMKFQEPVLFPKPVSLLGLNFSLHTARGHQFCIMFLYQRGYVFV